MATSEESCSQSCAEIEGREAAQAAVFDVTAKEGARVLEVLEDDWTGYRRMEVSNTFVVTRPRG